MTDKELGELLAREEAERQRMTDPAERWRISQRNLAWAARQPPARQFTPAARITEQNRKLAFMREYYATNSPDSAHHGSTNSEG